VRGRWTAIAAVALFALLAVPGANATFVNALDAQMTVGEAFSLPTHTLIVEEAPGDVGFGTLELNAPPGFEFDEGSPATAAVIDAAEGCNEAIGLRLGIPRSHTQTVTPEASRIVFLVSAKSRGRCTGAISVSGIVVNPLVVGSGNPTLGGTSRVRGYTPGSTLGFWTARAPIVEGTTFAWGSNNFGELGLGFSSDSVPEPEPVTLGPAIAAAAGDYNSFAVLADGTVWGWGMNSAGALGDGGSSQQHSPVQAVGVTNAVAVAAGAAHTLALLADGTLWAWGGNWDGMLGDGTTDNSMPKAVPGLTDVVQTAAGRESSFALTGDGTLYAWGNNRHGQLGTGDFERRLVPTPVLSGVRAISAGHYFVLVLKTDGTVWGVGNNDYGQLGIGAQTPAKTDFVQAGITGATLIGTGNVSSFAGTGDGTAWGWGANEFGQIGLGFTSEAVPTPTAISALSNVEEFAGGQYHTLALRSDGSVWAFGNNFYGQLGVGNDLGESYSAVPVRTHLPGATHVAARELHSLAIR
jgi:alpha-tubulin suppressor-like RCC1 family protein